MKLKRLACTFLVLTVMMLSVVASAAPVVPTNGAGDASTVSPQAEETQWVYRIYDGKVQKRLWSLTRGIWLTDWIDC